MTTNVIEQEPPSDDDLGGYLETDIKPIRTEGGKVIDVMGKLNEAKDKAKKKATKTVSTVKKAGTKAKNDLSKMTLKPAAKGKKPTAKQSKLTAKQEEKLSTEMDNFLAEENGDQPPEGTYTGTYSTGTWSLVFKQTPKDLGMKNVKDYTKDELYEDLYHEKMKTNDYKEAYREERVIIRVQRWVMLVAVAIVVVQLVIAIK